jgi:hypothetical protein
MQKRVFASLLVVLTLTSIAVIYGLLIRPWHMRWGATDEEISMALPGDSYIPQQAVVSTRAITIHARPDAVWPWIVQLGQDRGGFYSYDWLENLFAADMQNANQIMPELQQIQVGDHVSLQRNGPFAVIARIENERALVMEGGWTWYLEPVDEQSTRLIVRYASFEVSDPFSRMYYYPIFEPAHFVMEHGMMLGIKARAEGTPKIEVAQVTGLEGR